MCFCYKGIAKKCTSPSNEFLLHRIEWKNTQVLLMSFSYIHACGQTDIYLPHLDKRYSPIISKICEPKKQYISFLKYPRLVYKTCTDTLGLRFERIWRILKHELRWTAFKPQIYLSLIWTSLIFTRILGTLSWVCRKNDHT